MPRISIKTLLVLVAFLALVLVPFSWVVRHLATWGPAEQTENMISELRSDISGVGDGLITIEKIEQGLALPKFEFLKNHRAKDVELRGNELIWFSPNTKYSIGLESTGSIVWITNGKRQSD